MRCSFRPHGRTRIKPCFWNPRCDDGGVSGWDDGNHGRLVGLAPPFSPHNSMPSHQQVEKLYAKQKGKTPAAKPRASGLDLEQQISTPVEAELFS